MAVEPSTIDDLAYSRLKGTGGKSAAVGEVVKLEGDSACWKLHPNYAAWFWPLMTRVNDLVLLLPKKLLEPVEPDDSMAPPSPPTDDQKRMILQMVERAADCARVYTLAIRGKPALVHKAFPTRVANLAILQKYRGTSS